MEGPSNNRPHVSCLCVTERRAAFMPWLLWCFDRQNYPARELIVVDGSADPPETFGRDNVRVVRSPPGARVGLKRNLALREARGDVVAWFDDDDWQHPARLTELVAALAGGRPIAGPCESWFVDLWSGGAARYRAPAGQVIFNGSAFRRAPAAQVRFPEDVVQASDSRWMAELMTRHRRDTAQLACRVLSFWLCHHQNLSNPSNRRRFSEPLARLKGVIGPDAWADTDDALEQLRQRIKSDTTTVPSTGAQSVVTNAHPGGLQTARVAAGPEVRSSGSASNSQHPHKVTACLLSWRRPQHMQAIVDCLHAHPFIDEILVWNNNPAVTLRLRGDKVRIIQSEKNLVCYGRFACAALARNDVIYVQDDDVIVRNVPEVYRHFNDDPNCITGGLSDLHYRRRDRYNYADAQLALLGWGSFFRKQWLSVLDPFAAGAAADPLFLREADIFFTVLLGRRHRALPGQLTHFPESNAAGLALWRDPDHESNRALAVRRALEALRRGRPVPTPVTWNVVVPCHNYGRYLEEAVRSVLRNDADYVVTIVDDASADETPAVCARLARAYPQVSAIRLDTPAGVSGARNRGIAAIDSLFVVLLDADDRISPSYLFEAERKLLAGADVANPDAILFGNHTGRWPTPPRVDLSMLARRNPVHYCSAFRRGYWAQVGGFDEQMENWEDYEFWIRVAKARAKIERVPGDHFYYRRHGRSRSDEAAGIAPRLRAYLSAKHPDVFRAPTA